MNDILYVGKHSMTHHVSRHAHTGWEMVYCTGGSGCFTFDGEIILPYEKGDIVVIPPLMPHKNSSEEGFTNIHINMADCAFPFQEPTRIKDDTNTFIYQAFAATYFHFCGDSKINAPLLSAYGELIVCYLRAYHKTPSHSKIVGEIEADIIENYSDCNYELDQFLQSFPFSYDYIRRIFKRELGITPHQFLIDKRLQTAATFLSNKTTTGNNITEISRMCGFREPLYFSRMFKKKYGISPSFYPDKSERATEILNADSVKIPMEDA